MKRMTAKKKFATTAAVLALVGAAGIGGTLAYFTDSEQHTNVFTYGDVQIDLEEPAYAALTEATRTNVYPNEILGKDPKIENTGVNDAIVFIKMTVPRANVTLVEPDGTKGAKQIQELYWFKDAEDSYKAVANNFDADWIELDSLEGTPTDTERVYIFGYKKALKGSADSTPISGNTTVSSNLYDKIQVKNILEDEVAQGTAENIKVEAYAIQANGILLNTPETPYVASDNMTKADLTEIYQIFVEQGTKTTPAEAAENNAKDLAGAARP